jgi:hypothetical protein
MNEATSAWVGDWRTRILGRVRESGCSSLLEYLAKYPGEPYLELADRLGRPLAAGGNDVAATQVQALHFEAASQSPSDMRNAAQDALVRLLRQHLRRGWNTGPRADFRRAGAKVDWVSLVSGGQSNQELLARAQAVWAHMCRQEVPDDWIPTAHSDQFLEGAFERGWDSPMQGDNACDTA